MPRDDLSGSQLEKLGDRLRDGPLTLTDLHQLRRYTETLEPFAEKTFTQVRSLNVEAAGLRMAQITRRNLKTLRSIVAKLRRQSTTLPQIQDLVGCRIVVPDVVDQDLWMKALKQVFFDSNVIDRRASPQHGYRAVHIVVREGKFRFEIQLRTLLQDRWANVVEKIDDRFRLTLKYGTGDPAVMGRLQRASESIADVEAFQRCYEGIMLGGRGKILLATYVSDYRNAVDEAWDTAMERARHAWLAARQSALKSGRSWYNNDARNFFELSRHHHEAWDEVETLASRFLRLVLWSDREIPIGAAVTIGGAGPPRPLPVYRFQAAWEMDAGPEPETPTGQAAKQEGGLVNVTLRRAYWSWQIVAGTFGPELVTVLRKSDVADKAIVAPTFDDLRGGQIYEITQPVNAKGYLIDEDRFGDFVHDVETDLLNLEQLLA